MQFSSSEILIFLGIAINFMAIIRASNLTERRFTRLETHMHHLLGRAGIATIFGDKDKDETL